MSLHDAGLAARFSDHALLLFGNGEWLSGPTSEVLTPQTMTRLYGVGCARNRVGGRLSAGETHVGRSSASAPTAFAHPVQQSSSPTIPLNTSSCSWPLLASTELVSRSRARPSRSVKRLPAASTITASAATSRMCTSGLDHDVDLARREQVVVQEIAIAANALSARDQLAETRSARTAREGSQNARGDRAAVADRDVAHPDRLLAEPRATPISSRDRQLAVHRRRRDADDQPAAMHESEDRVEKNGYFLAHERLRAVDRIDQPEVLRVEASLDRFPRRKAASGNRAVMMPRMTCSPSTSACVTGDLSAFSVTCRSRW